jgi:signal transduction histidine kinase
MKISISLKLFVSLVFLTMGIVLVVGYTKLSGRYFILGMDNMIASNMERSAQQYPPQANQMQVLNGLIVSREWQQQPADIQAAFAQAPTQPGELVKRVERDGQGKRPKNITLAMRYDYQQQTVYVSHTLPREAVTEMVDRNIKASRQTLMMISGLSVLALAVVLALLLWLVSRPITALGNWTRSLEADKLDKPIPNFSYPELNAMAELIRNSLYSVHEGLERKQQFLQHTSHELRTPISVIRNNIELLHRLQASPTQQNGLKQQEVINRIDRASLTMQHLTETLLWLSKETSEPLTKKEIKLNKLVAELVEEARYLLNDKNVQIELDTQDFTIKLPDIAAKIVLGNLIRNAFQHTWEGEVVIRQRNNQVEIINKEHGETIKENNLGFGLGLQLTQQLANRLGWTYENVKQSKEHRVEITFN